MNKQTEALNMAYKAEETGNLQDLVDAVNMLVEVVEGISKTETTTKDEALEKEEQPDYKTLAIQLQQELAEIKNKPAQEPVAFTNADELEELKSGMHTCYMYAQSTDDGDIALYTHPAPAREPLSDEEIERLLFNSEGFFEFARAIEQALRERNCNDTK